PIVWCAFWWRAGAQPVGAPGPLPVLMGYSKRRPPLTGSRTEAPLAQCDPRLIGESQLGSWPIHTPFNTSAVTVHPTEQCVQTLLRTVAPVVSGPAMAAFASRTLPIDRVPRAARAPPARPDRRRKVRRSRPSPCPDKPAAIDPREAEPCCVLLISTAASSTRITIDAVIGFHVVGLLIARLALLIVGLAVGLRRCDQRRCQRRTRADRADADLAEEIAAACRFLFVFHRISP